MKKIISLISLSLISTIMFSFIAVEKTSSQADTIQDYELMLGEFDLEDLKATKNKTWFSTIYDEFTPDPEVVKTIQSELKTDEFNISIYMGTWCKDSRREFPHLIKLLEQADFDLQDLKIVGVARDKVVPKASEEERKQLNITNVPTIIVYDKDGQELNRFVEFAQETLEKDLLKIISGADYKHVYDF